MMKSQGGLAENTTWTGSSFFGDRRGHRTSKAAVIAPKIEIVDKAWNADTTLVDGNAIDFRDETDGMTWQDLANNFVLDMHNKQIKHWVKQTHAAKVQTERKMRSELD